MSSIAYLEAVAEGLRKLKQSQAAAIEAAAEAPYRALVTIDEIYPDRPDRG